jgi:L-xylulokinase
VSPAGHAPMGRYLLGIDNGSTLIKAALFDLDGREVSVSSRASEVATPSPGRYERTLDAIWAATAGVVSDLLAASGVRPGDILCAAVTGHGGGVHLLDRRGEGLYPAMEGVDTRAAGIVERWMADGTFRRVHPRTLVSFFPAQAAPLLGWLMENEPAVLERAQWILPLKDYVRFRLTGRAMAELTNMSGSGLLDTREARYDAGLLAEYGLSSIADKLPPLCGSTELCGSVTREAAALTGLAEGTPVAAGVWDIDAAALSTGVIDEGFLNIVAGTWANNQLVTRRPVVSPELFMCTLFCAPGSWLLLEGSPTSASNLEWFVRELMGEERRRCREEGSSVYGICTEEVDSLPPEEPVPVFLPFLYGSSAGAGAEGAFIGMTGQHRRAHMLRAVFEGIAFSHRSHVERLAAHHPLPAAARIAGGAAGSRAWLQIFADTLRLPIESIAARELGALGSAITAGVACGAFPGYPEAVRAMVHVAVRVEPGPRGVEALEGRYARYRAAIDSLALFWRAGSPAGTSGASRAGKGGS